MLWLFNLTSQRGRVAGTTHRYKCCLAEGIPFLWHPSFPCPLKEGELAGRALLGCCGLAEEQLHGLRCSVQCSQDLTLGAGGRCCLALLLVSDQ